MINDNLEVAALNKYKLLIKHNTNNLLCSIADIGIFNRGKNLTTANMKIGNVPVISAGLKPSGYHSISNVVGPSITISGSGVNAGFVSLHYYDIWASDCSFNNDSEFIHFLYLALKSKQDEISELQKGTAQPHVYPKDLHPMQISCPNREILIAFEKEVTPLFNQIHINKQETAILQQLKHMILQTLSSH